MAETPDPTDQLAKAFASMSPDQIKAFAETLGSKIGPSLARSLSPELDRLFHRLGHSDEVHGLVQLLAARSDDSKEEVLKKALTLYGLALDAREKGNRMAILDPDDVIIHEVVGFEPAESNRQTVPN